MNTATSYLGLQLSSPFMVGASPLAAHLDSVKRLEDAGSAAIVLHSLFEEQISMAESGRIHRRDPFDAQFSAALAPFPQAEEYPLAPDAYLEHLRLVKLAVGVPVIASLNGSTPEAWLRFGKHLEEAGADALELNCYDVVTDFAMPGVTVESKIQQAVTSLKGTLHIPVAVKLLPYFTAFGNFARQLDQAGADGLVIFNRFYQPDIDIKTMTTNPSLELSRNADLRLRLRWLAILHGRIRPSLAATGGVETPNDAIKALLAGADVVQVVSAVLRHGPSFLTALRDTLVRWMEWHKVGTLDEVRGRASLAQSPDPAAFERGNYIRTLQLWNR